MVKSKTLYAPSLSERHKKSYKMKVTISRLFIKLCDACNPTKGKLYRKALSIVDRDETIPIFKPGENIYPGPYGSLIRTLALPNEELELSEAVFDDFRRIFADKLDQLFDEA